MEAIDGPEDTVHMIAAVHMTTDQSLIGALAPIPLDESALVAAASTAPEHFDTPGPQHLAEAARYITAYLQALGLEVAPSMTLLRPAGPTVRRQQP